MQKCYTKYTYGNCKYLYILLKKNEDSYSNHATVINNIGNDDNIDNNSSEAEGGWKGRG